MMAKKVPQRRTNRSMGGMRMLHKAAKSKRWQRMVDNKLPDTFGETDTQNHTIKINKNLHKQKSGGHLMRNRDGTEKLIGTIVHEELHAAHPKAHEKTIRKATKRKVQVINRKTKQKLYSRYK